MLFVLFFIKGFSLQEVAGKSGNAKQEMTDMSQRRLLFGVLVLMATAAAKGGATLSFLTSRIRSEDFPTIDAM